jgi:hypothetical protein
VRTVCWFSHGAASAVATKLTLKDFPDAVVALCDTGAEHPDNERFRKDCEAWFEKPVTVLSSPEYIDTWHVWEGRRYLAGIAGAPCTAALKKTPRILFQRLDDIHVFGYTSEERDRRDLFIQNNPLLKCAFPLIDKGLNKAACLAMVQGAGIELPAMYGLGFHLHRRNPRRLADAESDRASLRLPLPHCRTGLGSMTRLRGIPLDTCEACGEIAFDGRRCSECGSLSLDYLHELVRRDLASLQPIVDLEAKRRDDGRWEVAA